MPASSTARLWVNRVRHDLVKRVLWVARDCRALGCNPLPGSLVTQCINDEGQPLSALECWRSLRFDAPLELELADFEQALVNCLAAAERTDLEGVLALEEAFERLLAQTD